jgi:hypothetical protein
LRVIIWPKGLAVYRIADDLGHHDSLLQNEDLFWALRGGGGNFGVVTSFEFQLHEVGDVVGGPLFYEFDDAAAVLACYREFIAAAPEQLGCFFGWQIAPPVPFVPDNRVGDLFCALVTCWNGPHGEADKVLKPLRDVAEVKAEQVRIMPFPVLNSAFDDLVPKGMQHFGRRLGEGTGSQPALPRIYSVVVGGGPQTSGACRRRGVPDRIRPPASDVIAADEGGSYTLRLPG